MKIAIGADHGGYRLKNKLLSYLRGQGYIVVDLGAYSPQRCDYPPVAQKVAAGISQRLFSRGILICKSGIGFSVVANKFPGIRAALCLSRQQARSSRQHNNANILVLAANYLSAERARKIVDVWLTTEFSGGRHRRRVRQIAAIEKRIQSAKWSPTD